jgi:hypothetical protein
MILRYGNYFHGQNERITIIGQARSRANWGFCYATNYTWSIKCPPERPIGATQS